ncbi:MAG: damage-control phosphatase ARMT1 family protein [Bryobacteraceae bacterium]
MSRGIGNPRMNLSPDCIPCFVRHALDMARIASTDAAIHERVLREVLSEAAGWDMSLPAPVLSQRVHRRLRALTGVADPYQDAKRRFNELALEILPEVRLKVQAAADPLEAAVRVAIAGNVIDVGANGNLREVNIKRSIAKSLTDPFAGDLDSFRAAISNAEKILYLADNTGEIVFDRLLVEQLPARRVTIAVRGAPVLNDATLADARVAGLDQIAEVIDTGSDVPGINLEDCCASFRERFESADTIIAKGQGNFETLAGGPGDIFFLLKIKCPVVAAHTGLDIGTQALIQNRGRSAR